MTVVEAARVLEVAPRVVYDLCSRGLLGHGASHWETRSSVTTCVVRPVRELREFPRESGPNAKFCTHSVPEGLDLCRFRRAIGTEYHTIPEPERMRIAARLEKAAK